MLKLSLIVLFFAFASAKFGLHVTWAPNVTLQTFECLAQNNSISLIIADISNPSQGPDYYFMLDYNLSKAAGIPVDASILLYDGFTPEDFCADAVHALPADFNGTVWLYITEIWKRAVGQRMDYLDDVIQNCQQRGLKVGVFSNRYDWYYLFNDRYASSETVKAVPVLYPHDDSLPDFDDWDWEHVAFGKWDAPTMKIFTGFKENLCGVAVSLETYFE